MPTGAVQSVPPAAWVAELMKEIAKCFSLVAFQTTITLPPGVIATCGSPPSGSERHRFSAEMFRGLLHRFPRRRVAARMTRASPWRVWMVSFHTITAFPADAAISGPSISSLTGAMVTGGDQPFPGSRLLTRMPFGRLPTQVAIASPSGATATSGAPASRPVGPRVVGGAHEGAASAVEEKAIVAAMTSAAETARVKRNLMG
jgi:hypothetical protein